MVLEAAGRRGQGCISKIAFFASRKTYRYWEAEPGRVSGILVLQLLLGVSQLSHKTQLDDCTLRVRCLEPGRRSISPQPIVEAELTHIPDSSDHYSRMGPVASAVHFRIIDVSFGVPEIDGDEVLIQSTKDKISCGWRNNLHEAGA